MFSNISWILFEKKSVYITTVNSRIIEQIYIRYTYLKILKKLRIYPKAKGKNMKERINIDHCTKLVLMTFLFIKKNYFFIVNITYLHIKL